MLRNARVDDVDDLNNLINYFAEKNLILPKTLSELYENIRDYYVYLENGNVIGCVALHVYDKDLAEIKSLAVKDDYQNRGISKKLIQKCFEEGTMLGLKKLFVLTHIPDFFENIGFKRVDRGLFPQKIWTECVKCYKFTNCEGVALMIEV